MGKILIVDDEAEISELVELYLRNVGFVTFRSTNGNDALKIAQTGEIDLAVLDVMLPDIDGFELCRKLREEYTFPIIMLTAKISDMDKITGLTIGADDYVTKPFNPLELVARIQSQLRRCSIYDRTVSDLPPLEYDFSGLYISKSSRKCILFGEELCLTPTEFDILWFLCENRGKVVSAEELFEEVWKEKYLDSNNTVMAHIARIREKMHESGRSPKFIKTVWGVGYTIG